MAKLHTLKLSLQKTFKNGNISNRHLLTIQCQFSDEKQVHFFFLKTFLLNANMSK